jgi:HEAT repeat protein
MASREAIDDVLALTRDPISWEVRNEALKVLVVLARDDKGVPDAKAIAQLKKASWGGPAGFLPDPSYLVRITAVQGFGAIGDASNLKDLDTTLRAKGQSQEVRLAVIPSMAMAGKAKSLQYLWPLLDESSKEIRLVTVQSIAALKLEGLDKKRTIDKLSERISTEPEPVIVIWLHTAIMTLDPTLATIQAHLPPIISKLNDKDMSIRLLAMQMIRTGGEKSKKLALPAVLNLVDDKDMHIALPAIETLVHIHAFEAIPKLEQIKKAEDAKAEADRNFELRDAADNAILLFGRLKKELETPKEKTKSTEKK